MRLLMIGDVVGRPGRKAVKDNLPGLIQELNLDFVIANGENAAGGNGITREIVRELCNSGVDVITMGNHVWSNKDIYNFIQKETCLIRPANYPAGVPGKGYGIYETRRNVRVAVINLSGRVFMQTLDCPFRIIDQILETIGGEATVVVVDFHAEATSEKVAMGWYLNGRVTAICGTHTHIQTADERVLPDGTAYITDLGMTGPRDSVIGVKTELVLDRFITQIPRRLEVAHGLYQFNGVVIDIDEYDGKARNIERIITYE